MSDKTPMWEKCPVCKGTGVEVASVGLPAKHQCRFCKGKGTISISTNIGKPPA